MTLLDPSERQLWLTARGLPADQVWFGGRDQSDYATGAGDFAEAFMVWQVDAVDYRSRLGAPPSPSQLSLLEELVS